MVFVRAHAAAVLSVAGCAFDSEGGPGGASAEIGESSADVADDDQGNDDGGTTAGSNDATTASSNDATSDVVDSGEVDTAVDEGTTMAPVGDPAVLEFTEAPLYDFTLVALDMTQTHVVTLTNTGGRTATGILGAAPAAPFGWAGGAWPGTGGNCGETLEPSGSCIVDLSFFPTTLGPTSGAITVDYDDGEAPQNVALGLAGAGAGEVGLLANGDAEANGNPPPSWVELNGTGWTTTTGVFRTGARSITAGEEPNGELVLRQTGDVSAYAALIDEGALSITFNGWSRAYGTGDDSHFFRVDFENDQNQNIDMFVGNPHSSSTWTQTMDVRSAPVGTRRITVRLHCTKAGGYTCDGFFDDMSLVASYP